MADVGVAGEVFVQPCGARSFFVSFLGPSSAFIQHQKAQSNSAVQKHFGESTREKTLTVQHRLTDRHHTQPKPTQTRHAPPSPTHTPPPQPPPPTAPITIPSPHNTKPKHDPQVPHITPRLHQIQRRLRSRKPAPRVPRRPPVRVIHLAVQFIRCPERGVQGAAGHGEWAEENVGSIPDDEGKGEEKPGEGEGGWGVGPISRARGGRARGFGGGERGRGEGCGVGAGGDHGCW